MSNSILLQVFSPLTLSCESYWFEVIAHTVSKLQYIQSLGIAVCLKRRDMLVMWVD